MGSVCQCTWNQNQTQPTPRKIQSLNLNFEQKPIVRQIQLRKKHENIVPLNHFNTYTERQLADLHDQLNSFIVKFEGQNGVISKRLNKNETENSFQSKFSQSNFTINLKDIDTSNFEDHEKQTPLISPYSTNKIQLEQIDMENSTEKEKSNSSCKLSHSTQILNKSIFTDRQNQKKIFYSKYSKLSQIQLYDWEQLGRQSFKLSQEFYHNFRGQNNAPFAVCLGAIENISRVNSIQLLSFNLINQGLKIYLNGTKRLLPINFEPQAIPDLNYYKTEIVDRSNYQKLSQIIFILTGWMPEQINMSQISNFNGIFQRLASNLEDANTIITFTRQTANKQIEHAFLQNIDLKNQKLTINSCYTRITIPTIFLKDGSVPQKGLYILNFQDFIELYDSINLNWNPSIYEISIKTQGILIKNQNKISQQYLLTIPPSSEDIEVRIFLQKHNNFQNSTKKSRIQINLYDNQGVRIDQNNKSQFIRTISTQKYIYSDVFIFQYSKEKSEYILTVTAQDKQYLSQPVYYTLTLLSFVEMHFKQIHEKQQLDKIELATQIFKQNRGYGINSPFFDKNIQFSIQTQSDVDLHINVDVSKQLHYEICLIADPENTKNLMKINLENIINKSITSPQKKGKSSFSINTEYKSYILIINAYTQVASKLNIQLKMYGNDKLTHKLTIQQISKTKDIFYTKQIKWFPTNFGPRKRLKSNSTPIFHPLESFTQFFKNPLIEKRLAKGLYQFYIKSDTFQQYFQSVQPEDKNLCQPPALSMVVFQFSEDKTFVRIVIDDAYYVPFGLGFWTKQIFLQQGDYRFVLPKMQKDFSRGTFGIMLC